MNREDNYYYNGRGYADPTAAAVIGKITMEIQMFTDPKPFEVWQLMDGTPIMTLSVCDRSIQYVKLFDSPSYRQDEIMMNGKYFNPRYIAYTASDNCKGFLRMLKSEEIDKVKSSIASVFDIVKGGDGDQDEVLKLKQELNDRETEMSELRKALDVANDKIAQYRHSSPDAAKLEKKISSQQLMIDLLIEKLAEVGDGKE